MKPKHDIDPLSHTHSQAYGFAGGVGALAGAAIGGVYLAPQTAGSLQIAAWIAGGAAVGGLFSVLGVYGLTRWLGPRPVVLAFVIALVAALTAMGGVGGYVFTGGRFSGTIGGAVMLFLFNTLLFASTRDRWLRTGDRSDASRSPADGGSAERSPPGAPQSRPQG